MDRLIATTALPGLRLLLTLHLLEYLLPPLSLDLLGFPIKPCSQGTNIAVRAAGSPSNRALTYQRAHLRSPYPRV